MKVVLLMLTAVFSFLALAQSERDLVGSWSLSGFVCDSSGNFRVVSVPEQLNISGQWEMESDGSMRVSALIPGAGRCEMSGFYRYQDSILSYTVEDMRNCPGGGRRGQSQEHEDVIVDNDFLYIPAPEGLEGGREACRGRLYEAFSRRP